MNSQFLRKRASGMALAIALATGAVVTSGVFVAEPAQAQRDKKKKDKEAEKPVYSKEFVEAYTPVNEAVNSGRDVSLIRPQIDALIPLAQSPDEKNALGGLLYNAAISIKDPALQAQGMEMMLASGKVAPERLGRFNFIAFQLRYAKEDFAGAQQYLQGAIDNGFTSEQYTAYDLKLLMFETKVSGGQLQEALSYIGGQANGVKNQGGAVPEGWYRRAISVAYEAELGPQLYPLVQQWVSDYPTAKNWNDAINITRNLNEFDGQASLDLLRLSNNLKVLSEENDYVWYVEIADPQRLPQEVKTVIEQGYATGAISRDNDFIVESLAIANSAVAADRADLPAIEKEASAPGAPLRIVRAAASAFLSYGDYAKAEAFYAKAAAMPGADRNEMLTRLGMAQIGVGKFDAAQASLAQVAGVRAPIAMLWSTYAAQQGAPAAPVVSG
ncbi:MAG: hypothetical protein ABJP70_10105 [Erythrobacter sp.]